MPDSFLQTRFVTALNRQKKVIVIFAPTACGKTALARELFGRSSLCCFKGEGEVVSADSQAVYIGMDVGTAKADAEERKDIPHHLLDVVPPDVQFGVGDFLSLADKACTDILSRGKYPLVIGGTGFYIRNFLLGLPVTPVSDPVQREALKARMAQEGSMALYQELMEADALAAQKINPHDEYRIIRALEVYYSSGRPLSSYKLPVDLRKDFDFLPIILTRSREELYRRIDARVEQMFLQGLAEEVERLKSEGYSAASPGMKAIGYSEFFLPHLSVPEIKQRIKNDSHRYAKKQYTFMRGIPHAVSFPADDTAAILSYLQERL